MESAGAVGIGGGAEPRDRRILRLPCSTHLGDHLAQASTDPLGVELVEDTTSTRVAQAMA